LDILGAYIKTYAITNINTKEPVTTDIEKVPFVFTHANRSMGSMKLNKKMSDGTSKMYKDTVFTMFNITENALKEYITLNTIDDMIAKKYPTAKFPEPKFGT
jgi:hypothetical protein